MKGFFIILFLVVSLLSTAQFEFPDSNATWVQVDKFITNTNPVEYIILQRDRYCLTSLDTVIATETYHQLTDCFEGYMGAIRTEAERVHFVIPDSLQEVLLYDFGANEGDTLENVYYKETGAWPTYLGAVRVAQIDSNNWADGRKLFYIQPLDGSNVDYSWLEGLGTDFGLLMGPTANVSFLDFQLECFSYSDTTYFNGYSFQTLPGNCALDTHTEEMDRMDLRIYPNPTSGIVNFNIREIKSLSVFAIDGRRIELGDDQVTGSTLDLTALPTGLYILDITTENEHFSQRIIKE